MRKGSGSGSGSCRARQKTANGTCQKCCCCCCKKIQQQGNQRCNWKKQTDGDRRQGETMGKVEKSRQQTTPKGQLSAAASQPATSSSTAAAAATLAATLAAASWQAQAAKTTRGQTVIGLDQAQPHFWAGSQVDPRQLVG